MFGVNNWDYGKKKKYNTVLKKSTFKSIPVISGITKNNGIIYYTEDEINENEIYKDELTISTRGEYSGTVFYHPDRFVLANNILVMKMPNMTKKQKQFIGSLINCLPYGGYSDYPKKETLAQTKIKLPIKNKQIDFEFMESFITELKAERITKLDAYLLASGLKDYTLTSEEKWALDDFKNVEWGEFKLGDLFEINSSKKIYHAKEINKIFDRKINNSLPYVVRTTQNNGLRGYIIKDELYANDKNTLSFAQDTFSVFYQKEKYFTGNKVKVLKPKFTNKSEQVMQFLTASFQKSLNTSTWGLGSTIETIAQTKIKLPIKNKQIDFEFMESFIAAIQKLVIKDVILYSNKISEIKTVIDLNN